jgi:flagellar hook protein FlgE
VSLSAFQLEDTNGNVVTPNIGFGTVQEAVGQSAVADFVAYDSLGIPLNVRVTAVLQSRSGSNTTYRWFADSPDNDPLVGTDISVGTGLVTFDGNGNLITSTNSTVSIDRRNVPSVSPLEFTLDFSQISGLAAEHATLAASRQDGSAPGTLTSFIIGEDGRMNGVFSNGATRDLGQIRLARFANNSGLEQKGENLYAAGVNSGLPIEGDPGEQGGGEIRAGAVELSNADIGANLIDLILATTQYRGNSRVITTSQELLDELLNLRR